MPCEKISVQGRFSPTPVNKLLLIVLLAHPVALAVVGFENVIIAKVLLLPAPFILQYLTALFDALVLNWIVMEPPATIMLIIDKFLSAPVRFPLASCNRPSKVTLVAPFKEISAPLTAPVIVLLVTVG